MPWSNNNGGPKSQGPWGGGGGGNGGGGGPWGGGPRGGGGGGGQGPNIDDLFKKGQKGLKNVLGDGGRGGGGGFGGALVLAAIVGLGAWAYVSVFQVQDNEQAVILTFGEYTDIVGPGLNFAPWPIQTAEIRATRAEKIIEIGNRRSGAASAARTGRDSGLMLTGDENIIDINFQVAWNISELDKFLFTLEDPTTTIKAVAESAMREVVGRSALAPLLNRERQALADQVEDLIQTTLDDYESGVNIIRVTLDRADPPPDVVEAFLDVQAAAQQRDTLLKQAQAYFNEQTAGARGEAAQILQEAEAYKARVVAGAQGEAGRFNQVYDEYVNAKEVTRKRLYIETMEKVFGGVNKIIIDENGAGSGVVPYLPLDQLQRNSRTAN